MKREYSTHYSEIIQKYPLLAPKLAEALVKNAKAGDLKARETLILSNIHTVYHWAKKYAQKSGKFNFLLDIVQDGIVGLIESIDKYEPDRSKAYTYFIQGIKMAIYSSYNSSPSVIKIPKINFNFFKELKMKQTKLCDENGAQLILQEILNDLDMSLSLKEITQEKLNIKLLSLDNFSRYDENQRDHYLQIRGGSDGSSRYEKNETIDKIRRELDNWFSNHRLRPPVNKDVFMLRKGLTDGKVYTLEEVGKKFGITKERVRQIEADVDSRIKKYPENLESCFKECFC